MFKNLKKLIKNKYFVIFAILIIIMFPSTLYMQSDKDNTIVITTIGIDKEDDQYGLTVLAVIPKGGNDINANLEVFEAKGDTISQALDTIALDTGKKIGLAHCDCIIVSQEILDENITKITDYFIRTANLTTNATLVATDSKAKKLIEATKSSNNLLDLSLKNIVTYQEKNTMLDDITLERFYRTHYMKSSTFFLPVISVEESSQSGGSSSGGGGNESSGNASQDSTGGGDSSSQSQQTKIKNDSKIAILEHGEFSRYLNDDEKFIYNLISNNSDTFRIEIENINDQYVNNSKEIYQQISKTVIPFYTFDEDKPVVVYNIWLSVMIDEIISEDNFSYASIDSLQNFLSPVVEEKIKNQINEKLSKTNDIIHAEKDDILGLYEKFNAFHPFKWKDYINSLDNQSDYMAGVELKINLHLNYVI